MRLRECRDDGNNETGLCVLPRSMLFDKVGLSLVPVNRVTESSGLEVGEVGG